MCDVHKHVTNMVKHSVFERENDDDGNAKICTSKNVEHPIKVEHESVQIDSSKLNSILTLFNIFEKLLFMTCQ